MASAPRSSAAIAHGARGRSLVPCFAVIYARAANTFDYQMHLHFNICACIVVVLLLRSSGPHAPLPLPWPNSPCPRVRNSTVWPAGTQSWDQKLKVWAISRFLSSPRSPITIDWGIVGSNNAGLGQPFRVGTRHRQGVEGAERVRELAGCAVSRHLVLGRYWFSSTSPCCDSK